MTIQDALLLDRGLDIVDRNGQTRLGREVEGQTLDPVQAGRDLGLGEVAGQLVDDLADVPLLDHAVHIGETLGQRLVEQDPTGGGRGVDRGLTVRR